MFRFGFWLAVGVVAVTLAMLALFRILEMKDRASDKVLSPIVAANLARTPPEPRLEPFPLAPGQRLRAEEDAILTSYAWADKKAGFARIPRRFGATSHVSLDRRRRCGTSPSTWWAPTES